MSGLEEDVRQLAAMGEIDLPGAVLNRPRLMAGLDLFYRGFWACSSCRQVGMGESYIPYTAFVAWSDEQGMVGEQRQMFFDIAQAMDREYMKYREKKRKEEREQAERERKHGRP